MPLFRRLDRTDEQERRKRNLLIIGGILVLLVVATIFEVGIRHPRIPFASNLIVFALFNLNLVVFLLLLVLLFRNLVKLYFERRHKVIGARFKAKLVLTFLRARPHPRHPDLHHRVELHHDVDRGLVQAPGGAAARPGDGRGAELLPDARVDRAPPRPLHGPRGASARGCSRTGAATPSPRILTEQQERLGVAAITVWSRQGQELAHAKNPGLGAVAPARHEPRAHPPGARRPGDHHRPGARQRRHDPGGRAGARRARDRGRDGRGHPRPPAARGAAARHQPGLPGVQAAQAPEEPDQGHLHPAVPPDDADHRVLRDVVRALPGARHHRSDRRCSPRARARSPRAT